MKRKWLSSGQPALPYAEFLRRVRGYKWNALPLEELKERIVGAEDQAERYSLLMETVRRCEGICLFDTQLAAARAIEEGCVVQLATGEGKTLAAVIAAASMALQGKSVHIFVFNDYLAGRDFSAHGDVFRFCGLTVGKIESKCGREERRCAYRCQVVYLTVREAGFDYLKNFLCTSREEQLHIPFHCAVVDEADSVLIDEARIPLVLAGPEGEANRLEESIRGLIEGMPEAHREIDEGERRVWLTDCGIAAVEKELGLENLYAAENSVTLARIAAGLEAEHFLTKGKDYLADGDGVALIDELTGRVAESRRYPDLLHRAVEEKEGVSHGRQTVLYNSMPLQFFLLQYELLAGMTGTAEGCERELRSMYGVKTVLVPSHVPCVRRDEEDAVFQTEKDKETAVVQEICRAFEKGRPVLLGTQSVIESKKYEGLLRCRGIPCSLLNAECDEEEAEIIESAGSLGRVTVSTNMAGRGVDIRLGGPRGEERQRVEAAGGLLVIGCGLNANSRVDRQLRGRAGRQGDPGGSRFFISLEEPVFNRFRRKDDLQKVREAGGSGRIEDDDVRRLIRKFQRSEEGRGAEARYMLERYAAVQEAQRQSITNFRDGILSGTVLSEFFRRQRPELYGKLTELYGKTGVEQAERQLILYFTARHWSDYLMTMENVRAGIHLTIIGGCNPLDEYHRFAAAAFEEMQSDIREDVIGGMETCCITEKGIDMAAEGLSGSTETWTYMIDESPGQFMRLPKFGAGFRK